MSTPTSSEPIFVEQQLSAGLQALVCSVRSAVLMEQTAATTAESVAANLRVCLGQPDLLPERYRGSDPDHYLQHVIHAEPDGTFSLVALVWLPGQETPIHDHVSWCVTGVHEGQEHEQRYEYHGGGADGYLVPRGAETSRVGDVCALTPPGDIHRVRNSADTLAISLHVYGADIAALGNSVRRTYSAPVVGSTPAQA